MNKEHAEQVAVLNAEVDELKKDVGELRDDVHELIKQLTRYKGFIGGVIFTFSCLVTAIGVFFNWKS